VKNAKILAKNCLACRACELQCAVTHTESKNINDAVSEEKTPNSRLKVTTSKGKIKILRCAHCKKPKCILVCENDAIKVVEGFVIIDEEKCDGCWKCIEACPLHSIFKNEITGTALKCDLCGGKEELACVIACKTGALTIKETKG
jgi:carbon-monoxide dehydrogenase iron sulfur subunit